MKRLVVCCDGTWQTLTQPISTNVFKIAQIIKPITQDGTPQLIHYQPGLGTQPDEFDKIAGGALGWGIDTAIQEAYLFLCFNYEPGDEIYLFGFSRGAYTVRSLAGFLYCAGLLQRRHIRKLPKAYDLYRNRALSPSDPDSIEFRSKYSKIISIKLLACWDTVGGLGVPDLIPWISEWTNTPYQFHDTRLNRQIDHALHAVAIDERRKVFEVTPMTISEGATTTLHQVWFPGTHGSVGGGAGDSSGLSNATLQWMMEMIGKLNLRLEFVDDPEMVADGGIKPDYTISFDSQTEDLLALGGISDRTLCSSDNDCQAFFEQNIHLSAKQRWARTQAPLYRPKSLEPYQQWLDAFIRSELTHEERCRSLSDVKTEALVRSH
jgi:uncharacterized protein (DUF2235 family)